MRLFATLGLCCFAVLVASSCGKPQAAACGPSTCLGCCDPAGQCLTGQVEAACGQGGAMCSACAADQICRAGTCTPYIQKVTDGGADGGETNTGLDGGVDGGTDGGSQSGGDGGAGGTDGGVDGGTCSGALAECSGNCVDLQVDPLHCGQCGRACSGGTCAAGECVATVDCRQPGNACSSGYYCDLADGHCRPGCAADPDCPQPGTCDLATHSCRCDPGFNLCGGACVQESAQSCGAACQACPAGGPNSSPLCQAGQCGLACAAGYVLVNGVCVDACAAAAAASSNVGCSFWGMVQDNMVGTRFRGGVSSGQGTVDSAFGFLIANVSADPATVQVRRHLGGSVSTVKTVVVPAQSSQTVYAPWQSLAAQATTVQAASVSGRARYAYRLQSDRPIAVWQFNVLDPAKFGTGCTTDSDCGTLFDPGSCDQVQKKCREDSYSMDSSLLLPDHALGSTYLGISAQHLAFAPTASQAPTENARGSLAVVATQDGTQVVVTSSARTLVGPGVPGFAKGQVQTFTLNSYEVLQVVTDHLGTSYLQCAASPFGSGTEQVCRVDNDLSGTVIVASHPVAVFGGAACALAPFTVAACDHVGEQVAPLQAWGRQFVGVRSHPLRTSASGFATPTAAGADQYKLLAACNATQCPNGTLVTFSTPPAAADVHAPNRCLSGSLPTNDCRLPAGGVMEFRSKSSFALTADQPIALTQFLPGQGATTGAIQGDPSMISLPPIEQWAQSAVAVTNPSFSDNYLSLAYDSATTGGVTVDGVAVAGFTPVSGTTLLVKAHRISRGRHVVTAQQKAGVSTSPAVGVLVYGFAEYVSYGSPAGQLYVPIATGLTP